jgi:dephospho-CoA kinase
MLKVGLTGGIGSGKTMVAKIFEVLGIPVYYADEAAKKLMNNSPQIRQQIITHFGENAYTNNQLNRKFIAAAVFNNTEKLNLLNAIVHPVTIADAAAWLQLQNTPYAIKEAALIFESGATQGLHFVVGVYAPKHLRIHRVMQRDGISPEEVLQRMQHQVNEEIKMKLCDFVIVNDEQHSVIEQVVNLHKEFKSLAAKKI